MDFADWLLIATTVVTAASAIAAVTTTPRDDRLFAFLYKIIDALALNLGRAKESGALDRPTETESKPQPRAGMPRGPGLAIFAAMLLLFGCDTLVTDEQCLRAQIGLEVLDAARGDRELTEAEENRRLAYEGLLGGFCGRTTGPAAAPET